MEIVIDIVGILLPLTFIGVIIVLCSIVDEIKAGVTVLNKLNNTLNKVKKELK